MSFGLGSPSSKQHGRGICNKIGSLQKFKPSIEIASAFCRKQGLLLSLNHSSCLQKLVTIDFPATSVPGHSPLDKGGRCIETGFMGYFLPNIDSCKTPPVQYAFGNSGARNAYSSILSTALESRDGTHVSRL